MSQSAVDKPGAPSVVTVPAAALIERGVTARHLLMVMLPVILAVVGAFSAWGFVHHALMSNPALNGLILGMLSWGIATMIGHLRRLYVEDDVFRRGIGWLRQGPDSGEQHPNFGPQVFVTGMIERMSKLGLGHQLHIHASAMEPEIEAVEHSLIKRQDLSQFLIGLMVGLGLLGTFIGLLETLVKTSELIGDIANSVGGGGDMTQNFTRIVGGLQKPLSAMGTAFSASMFGLVGSILLGFQMVAVRKATSDFVEHVRSEVLSLAEGSKVAEKVEITERFLATLLADILDQHQASSTALASAVERIDSMLPVVGQVAEVSARTLQELKGQRSQIDRLGQALEGTATVFPAIQAVAQSLEGVALQVAVSNNEIRQMLPGLAEQTALSESLRSSMQSLARLGEEVERVARITDGLRADVGQHTAVTRRVDSVLWNIEKDRVRGALDATTS